MNILICDDNDKMRSLIKNLLFENIRTVKNVYECKNGEQAIQCYLKYKPDWTLLDIKMNDLDGLNAAEKIKMDNPGAKIIIVTNYDEASYRSRAKNISVSAYVLKENLKDLLSILTNKHMSKLGRGFVL